jgi:O-antigen/teichoic acid export membrane protein
LFKGLLLDEPGSHAGQDARRAFYGSVALSVANFGRILLQTLVLPILARILGPDSYGVVALALPFIFFANMLADGGMGTALVRRANPSREVESTVFWLSTAIGVAIAVCICLAATPVSELLRQPRLAPALIALSPILVLCSSLAVANARISRARHFALFAVGDCLSVVFSSAAAILAALHGLGAWSLVIQQLTLWTTKAAWLLSASRFRPTFVCSPRLAKELLAFGLNNVGANIADFLGKSAPALVIGAQIGVIAVGQYSMAYQLVRIPDLVLSGPLFLATFTAVAALAASPKASADLTLRAHRLVASAMAPLFCGLAVVADLLVGVFLGPKWQGAAEVLAALAPAGFFLCFYAISGAVLLGLGRSDLQFRLSLGSGLAALIGVAVGARFGPTAAAAGVALGAGAVFPLYVAVIARLLRLPWTTIVLNLARPLAASVVMGLAVIIARRELADLPRSLELAALVLIGAVVFVLALALTAGRQLADDLRQTIPSRHLPRRGSASGGVRAQANP